MTPQDLMAAFEVLADAPDGVKRLRELVLQLAVRGKLVPQDARDEPATDLMRRVARERAARGGRPSKGRPVNADDSPFTIPSTWAWTRFGDVFECRLGKMLDKAKNRGELHPYLRNANVRWGAFDLTDVLEMRLEEAELPDVMVKAGDLVICEGGEPGRCAVWESRESFVIQKALHRARPYLVDSRYYQLHLRADCSSGRIAEQFTGATIQHFTGQVLDRHAVTLPPLAEQHRIVARVDELMGLLDRLAAARDGRDEVRRAARDAALAALRDAEDADAVELAWARIARNMDDLFTSPDDVPPLRQAILQLAVRGKLVPQEPNDAPAETVEVGTCMEFLNGYAFKSEWYTKDGVRLVRNQNVGHGAIEWTDMKRLSQERATEFARFQLRAGDIVLSLDRPLISTGLKVAVITEEDLPCLLLQRVACPRPKRQSVEPAYFLLWLKSPEFSGGIDPGRSNGVPHISTRQVEGMSLRLPALTEQRRIVERVGALMSLCDTLGARIAAANDLHGQFAAAAVHHLDV